MVASLDAPNVGGLIRTARLRRRLTQDSLAQLMGVSQTSVSKWESSVYEPSFGDLLKLGDVLAVRFATGPDGWTTLDPDDPLEATASLEPPTALKPLWGPAGAGPARVPLDPSEVELVDPFEDWRDRCDFYLTVRGDSMSPLMADGTIVAAQFATDSLKVPLNHLVVAEDAVRHVVVKIFQGLNDYGDLVLRSYNPNHETLSGPDLRLRGIVEGWWHPGGTIPS
jgi:transcriptional regulator with XRE-family HTH domain